MKTFQEKSFLLWYEHLEWDLTSEEITGEPYNIVIYCYAQECVVR